VLYELVSGRRAFPGETMAASLAATAILEPRPLEDAPDELEKLVRLCLRKDPERRLQNIADARIALEDLRDDAGAKHAAVVEQAEPGTSGRRWASPLWPV